MEYIFKEASATTTAEATMITIRAFFRILYLVYFNYNLPAGSRGFEFVFMLAWHGGNITFLEVHTEYCEQKRIRDRDETPATPQDWMEIPLTEERNIGCHDLSTTGRNTRVPSVEMTERGRRRGVLRRYKETKMPGFPTQTVGTPTNRGKARHYKVKGGRYGRWLQQ
jgi:hypothetical protein